MAEQCHQPEPITTLFLEKLRTDIENMNDVNQRKILVLLNTHNSSIINSTKNGTYINMTALDDSTLKKLVDLVKYIEAQESHITFIENQKEAYKMEFFNNA